MPNTTTVNLTNGVPSGPAGAATVSTIDGLIASGSPIKDGLTSNVATVMQFHNADNQTLPGTAYGLLEGGVTLLWNGATMDRQRGNVDTAALITHTAASAGVSAADQINYNGRGVQIGVNITAITGTTPTLQVIIEAKDAASGVYYPLLTSAALNATGFTALTVYPGGPVTANVAANQVLPRTWRVRTVIAGTTPAVTATVGASVIV